MALTFFNTLTRQKELFKPSLPGAVSFYTCGPTVYDRSHIGNLRTFVMSDLIRRVLERFGFSVRQVVNITDVDDKTIAGARAAGETLKDFTAGYETAFLENLTVLNIRRPAALPRATEFIGQMIVLIEKLLKRDAAYRAADGIYFKIASFPRYGQFQSPDTEGDFALWKFCKPEDGEVCWDASFGRGRPGWHIECSAMIAAALGEQIDLHLGGTDLIFPHHENENAQSETITGKPLARYWLHSAFVNIQGEKMAKSEGNVIRLADLTAKDFSSLDYRYLLLTVHYRTRLNFTWEGLAAAAAAYERLQNFAREWAAAGGIGKIMPKYQRAFNAALDDDLNLPQALAAVWAMTKDDKEKRRDKLATLLDFDQVLGLDLAAAVKPVDIPEAVRQLAAERAIARQKGDWKKADELRRASVLAGYPIDDTPTGPKIKRKMKR
ncbi:MAG: cysteine--tRNA ligase [Candidatus Vogelbacteria bacterium]|nr:cysteine--tRNA ligase [Candidatus Vogelbacteria bacterium]